jgi:Ca-activated chloride channel family protein
MQAVQSLTTDLMPQGGTAIGEAMDNALKAFEHVDAQNKVLILITDGENHEGDPITLAKKAKEAGIQVLTVGMGTKAGELIPVIENGQRQYVKDAKGNVVKSSLDEELLQTIASTADGVYLPGNGAGVLDSLYDQYIGRLKKSEYSQTRKKNFHERYQVFLLIGILLLATGM